MINKLISVIIPTFNSESRISACLESIQNQELQDFDIELIIIDDKSTDNTISKINQYKFNNVKIFYSGMNDIELSKWIGLSNCNGQYIFFLDDDNYLCDKNQLFTSANYLARNPLTKGVQSWKFHYSDNLSLADKYASIYGINDPFVYYLRKQDKISYFDNEWTLSGKIINESDSFLLVEFETSEIPTIGSQGFMCRSKDINLDNKSKFYHMDFAIENVNDNKIQICLLKNSVLHLHAKSLKIFLRKIKRNISLFYVNQNQRQYKYNLKISQVIKSALTLGTFIIPAYDSFKMFYRTRKLASLIHPFVCFFTIIIYIKVSLSQMATNLRESSN